MPRGLALAYYTLPGAAAFWAYAVGIVAVWAGCVASMCVLRRVKDLPKAVLARDVGRMVLCYVSPVVVGVARELLTTGVP